jgi:hypothetical protein
MMRHLHLLNRKSRGRRKSPAYKKAVRKLVAVFPHYYHPDGRQIVAETLAL